MEPVGPLSLFPADTGRGIDVDDDRLFPEHGNAEKQLSGFCSDDAAVSMEIYRAGQRLLFACGGRLAVAVGDSKAISESDFCAACGIESADASDGSDR